MASRSIALTVHNKNVTAIVNCGTLRGFRALCNILNIDVRSGARIKNQAESAAGFAACRQPGCALPKSGKQMRREDRMKNIAAIPCRGIALANAVLASAFLLTASAALATENGTTLWPEGVQTVVPAILPPPNVTQLYSYNLYYSASSFKNGQGQSVYPNIGTDA